MYLPHYPSGQSSEQQEEQRLKILSELKKREGATVSELMSNTFGEKRDEEIRRREKREEERDKESRRREGGGVGEGEKEKRWGRRRGKEEREEERERREGGGEGEKRGRRIAPCNQHELMKPLHFGISPKMYSKTLSI